MRQDKLVMGHGNWVTDEKFWGREKDLELFMQAIDEEAHQVLSAQRRMGKTSLMREAARRFEGKYICIFIDLQKCQSPADAIVELSVGVRPHQTIWGGVKGVFSNVFDALKQSVDKINVGELSVQIRAGLNAGNWQSKGDDLFDILGQSETPVLLLIDEFPILVNRMLKGDDGRITSETRATTEAFLTWLRKNSLKHQGKIRIVLSGSIGLGPILRQGRLSGNINNFSPFELEPWGFETAIGCLHALANNYELSFQEGVPQQMVSKLGVCIPHHVQLYFRNVYDRFRRQNTDHVTIEMVEAVYNQEMLAVRGHAELSHYEERLLLGIGKHLTQLAMELLTEAAVKESLTADALRTIESSFLSSLDEEAKENVDNQLQFQGKTAGGFVLEVLEHDGYLRQDESVFRFVSLLLRDWWYARHSFGYVLAEDR